MLPEISLIIPVYNEGAAIAGNLQTVHAILQEHAISARFIVVDDGSTDNTWAALQTAAEKLPDVHLIRLSRNFGKEAALSAGLAAVETAATVIIDADLQHPPTLIPEMVRLWRTGNYDVIEGVKTARGDERWWNKLGAAAFYGLLKKFSGIDLNHASDFKLLDRKVVAAWQSCPEQRTFFRGLAAWVGFRRLALPFAVAPRAAGNSRWSFFALTRLAIDAFTSFTSLPLQLITILGMLFLIGAIPVGIEALYMKLSGNAASGFTTVILLLLIIGGTLMISLGIIGLYLARIFEEVKKRPRYLVAEIVQHNA